MKKNVIPRLLAGGALAASALLSGCVQVVDTLNGVAYELDRENARRARQEYYHYYYCPRPAHDASAPGIK
jgi:hypothetical protein